ncbi:MAG: RNA-guided endonuclease IscB [Pseudomonadota bacterium]
MKVYVINKNENPLMPCKPAKARKLLRDGKAKPVKRVPFTIQLTWDCEENLQPITIGIDKGSKITGFCAIANGEILMSGYINHRTDVKKKMEARAANRRQRRSRLWHRPPRFNNRVSSNLRYRLPPSIKTNAEEIIRVSNKLPLPITQIIIEDVMIDIARLNNPNLKGSAYQKSNRLHENLRLATLMRDDFSCQQCRVKNTRLEAHHIKLTSEGGKDTVNNLITLCSECHSKVHSGKIQLKAKGVSGFKDKIAQRTMQGKDYLYAKLSQKYRLERVYGYQTAEFRKAICLSKDHDSDALAIATLGTGEIIKYHRENFYNINFRPVQIRRRYLDLPKKGRDRVKYQINKNSGEFEKGDIVLVKNRYVKQVHSIYSTGSLAFKRVKGEPGSSSPKNCRLLERNSSIVFSSINYH